MPLEPLELWHRASRALELQSQRLADVPVERRAVVNAVALLVLLLCFALVLGSIAAGKGFHTCGGACWNRESGACKFMLTAPTGNRHRLGGPVAYHPLQNQLLQGATWSEQASKGPQHNKAGALTSSSRTVAAMAYNHLPCVEGVFGAPF